MEIEIVSWMERIFGIHTAQRSQSYPRYFLGGIVYDTNISCVVCKHVQPKYMLLIQNLGPLNMSNLYTKFVMENGPICFCNVHTLVYNILLQDMKLSSYTKVRQSHH